VFPEGTIPIYTKKIKKTIHFGDISGSFGRISRALLGGGQDKRIGIFGYDP
jgi:hypothetical protein